MAAAAYLLFIPLIMIMVIALVLVYYLHVSNIHAHELEVVRPYDHSFTHECLVKPHNPQYGGGIVVNPEFKQGLKGWTTKVEGAKVEHKTSSDGNNYIVASVNANGTTSDLQNFVLEVDKLYAFSAWLQVQHGNAYIKAGFKLPQDVKVGGWVAAQQGCWSMLKGGVVVNTSGPAQLFFESDIPMSELWISSVSLQPFTHEEWRSHQDQSVEKIRKGRVKFQVVDERDQPVPNARVSIKQTKPQFPFGNVMNKFILHNPAYANWFLPRFKYTSFENELKWIVTEKRQGTLNYTYPDAMLNFTKSHGITARGHNVLWDNKDRNPEWVLNLTREALWEAANSRVDSLMNRYKEQFMHWDVVNENMHFSFFEDVIGENASALFYMRAKDIDPKTLLFLNDYFTLEKPNYQTASPWKYLQKIWELRRQGYQGHLGIGLQSHFDDMNLPYIRASIDVMHSANLPVWITELDMTNKTVGTLRQVEYLEQLLREFHAHQAVEGIIMWGGWSPNGTCFEMCLIDDNFKNYPTGDVVDKIIAEWTYASGVQGTTNANGCFQTSLYYGEYEATISHAKLSTRNSDLQRFKVVPRKKAEDYVVHFKIRT